MAKSLEAWKKSVFNKTIDFDNASYDCVDVSKSWIMYLTDKGWQEAAGWGNAKDLYANWSATYLDRIPRGNAPQLGDIVVMNGQVGGGYGHTGVVVGVDGRNITLYQQNTFTQQPVYTGVYDGYASFITGYLRPKVAFSIGDTPLESYQRVPVSEGARYREQPNTSARIIEVFTPPEAASFKGFVRGEAVDGNNIWFVGRFTGGYSHSSGYTDSSTNGLPDLTPVIVAPTPLADNQRQVGTDAMNIRSSAKVDTVNNNVVQLKQPTEVITVKGYVHGQSVDGIDVWFMLDDGNYTWSGGYTNRDVGNLPDLTPTAPTTPPPPTYPAPSTDTLVKMVVNKKHPNDPVNYTPGDLVNVGNGQQMRREAAAAILQMQTDAAVDGAGLYMGSGYRSYATQETVYANEVATVGKAQADRESARAGYSEHQTGLVMDFSPIDDRFADSKQYAWLVANAHKYGFVLRYPNGKEDVTGYMYEPWHWRYVGVTEASAMKAAGKSTLEEYYGISGGLYADQDENSQPGTETPGSGTPDPDDPVIVQPTPDPATPDVVTQIKTVVVNAVVTFFQAFIATWTATGFQLNKVAVAGAVGAATSLVWNTILKPFAIKQGWLKQ